MKLQDFTDEQLLAEMRRRLACASGVFVPCETCQRFRPGGYSAPDSYNPCQAGHTMAFKMPDEVSFTEPLSFGFHRFGCESRVESRPDPDPIKERRSPVLRPV